MLTITTIMWLVRFGSVMQDNRRPYEHSKTVQYTRCNYSEETTKSATISLLTQSPAMTQHFYLYSKFLHA